jgi:hypothetical protein
MGSRGRSYVIEAIFVGVLLPAGILFIPLSVLIHFHFCEWDVSRNPSTPRLSEASRIVLFIHANENTKVASADGNEWDIACAIVAGLLFPAIMLASGIFLVIVAGRMLFRSLGKPPPLVWDRTTEQLVVPRRQQRFQYSLLALMLLTVFLAVAMKFALAILGH